MSAPHDHHGPELNPVEARQGMMTGRMRYVLGISLFLAAAMMAIIWLVYSR